MLYVFIEANQLTITVLQLNKVVRPSFTLLNSVTSTSNLSPYLIAKQAKVSFCYQRSCFCFRILATHNEYHPILLSLFLSRELLPEIPHTNNHFQLKKPLEEPAPPPTPAKRIIPKPATKGWYPPYDNNAI